MAFAESRGWRCAQTGRRALVLVVLSLAIPCAAAAQRGLEVVERLTASGPRVAGSAAHAEAIRFLEASLREAGWEVEERDPEASSSNVVGFRPGRSLREIVIGAHYDTVVGSPGAVDNASGCALLLEFAREISSTPLEHGIRLVFFDREETDLGGSRDFVNALDERRREAVLAVVNFDMVGYAEGAPLILPLPVREGARAGTPTPAWLVHAVGRAGEAVGFEPGFGARRMPLAAQWAVRSLRLGYAGDSEPFLAAGVPAVLLSDLSLLRPFDQHHLPGDTIEGLDAGRLEAWGELLAATVLRLDRLAGRPRWENEYLVVGRVLVRRDLLWIGFLIWIVLVVRLRPGSWRDADAGQRKAMGRAYFPGFVFRILFLWVAMWIPSLGVLLVYPLGLLGLLRPRTPAGVRLLRGLALVPWAFWLVSCLLLVRTGAVIGWALPLAPTLLLVTTLAAFMAQTQAVPRAAHGSR